MSEMLAVRDLTVRFGGVNALDKLSFNVSSGEIHGIIGPNGAGKTTAINALTGFVPRVSGEITFQGKVLSRNPRRVTELGITRTFQTPATFPGLTAIENVMSGGDHRLRAGVVRVLLGSRAARTEEAAARDAASVLLERVGFVPPVDTPVSELSFGEHRKVEIARALMFGPKLLLLDEPTAGLTAEEVQAVAVLLRQVVDESIEPLSVVLVEHNVPLVFSLSDTVTAFREGTAIASGTPSEVRATDSVIESYLGGVPTEATVGADGTSAPRSYAGPSTLASRATLTVSDLESGYGQIKVLHGVNMVVEPGELILVYGRNGAGKSTLLNSIAGYPRPSSGQVTLGAKRLRRLTVSQIVRAGVGLVPQERGVIASLSVDDNLKLATVGMRLTRAEFHARRSELHARFPVLSKRTKQLAGTLSGGERQMLALAKVLIRHPQVLLLDEPSIGLAPTIVEQLRGIVRRISEEGISVVVAEQSVWWISPLATRAYLLEEGRVVAEGKPEEIIEREGLILTYLGDEVADLGTGGVDG